MLHTAFFDELGVGLDATEAQVRKAYLRLAKRLHPDRNPGDAEAKARFQRLERIYRVLSSDELRLAYMRFGEEGLEEEEDGQAGEQADEGEEEAEPFSLDAAAEVAAKLGKAVSEDRLREIVSEVNSTEYQPSSVAVWSDTLLAEEWKAAEAAAAPALRWARKQLSSLAVLSSSLAPRLAASLKVLDLSWNRIEELPSAFAQLAALRELDLSTNRFQALPACVIELSATLESLNMERNRLATLPDDFRQLTRLRVALFFGNQLETLPDRCFEDMKALKQLDISCNQLSRAPPSLVRLRASNEDFLLTCDPNVDFYSKEQRSKETEETEKTEETENSQEEETETRGRRRSARKRAATQSNAKRARRRR